MDMAASMPDHVPPELVFEFDIYDDPRLKDDLHVGYAEVMAQAPDIFWTPLNGGHWVIARLGLAEEILRDNEHFSSTDQDIPRIGNQLKLLPLQSDPPESNLYRQILMPYFSPKAVAQREDTIRRWAEHFVSAVAKDGHCEFFSQVASRFPVTVFMELMGIPFDRFESFRSLVERFFSNLTDPTIQAETYSSVNREMMRLIEARRAEPRGDLISVLVQASVNGRSLTDDELQRITFLLFLAGLDTVASVLAFSYRAFANEPGLQARLASNASDIPGFVEECIRLFGVSNSPRLVKKDCDAFGASFRKGEMVFCLNSQFGRDERENPRALIIDPERTERRSLTFATGAHLCLGHNLARTEIRVLTEEWLKQVPSFWIADGYKPEFRFGMVMAIRSLPLRWELQ